MEHTREPSQGHRTCSSCGCHISTAELSWSCLVATRTEPDQDRGGGCSCGAGRERQQVGKGQWVLPWGAAGWGGVPWRGLWAVWRALEAGAACLCAWAWRINPTAFQHCSERAWFWMHLQTETSRQTLKHRDWQTPETSLPCHVWGFWDFCSCSCALELLLGKSQILSPDTTHKVISSFPLRTSDPCCPDLLPPNHSHLLW